MKRRTIMTVFVSILTAAVLAGCGSSSSSAAKEASAPMYNDYEDAEPMAYAEEAMTDDVYEYEGSSASAAAKAEGESSDSVSDSEIMSNSNRKLIKTVDMSVETREFDKLIANVNERINSLGGYAESSNISGNSYDSYSARTAYIVARIPANKLDFFVQGIEDESNITSRNESAEDVTLQYADVEARKESLKIEQQRLNELLEKADTLENIIELENRLTEVRYEIESYESRLRTMNNQVVYATVQLNIREVKEYTPEPVVEQTFWERLAEGFLDSCEEAWETIQDFIIGFVSILPMLLVTLIILGVIFAIVFGIIKLIISAVKKSNTKKAAKKATANAPAQPAQSAQQKSVANKADEAQKKDGGDNK